MPRARSCGYFPGSNLPASRQMARLTADSPTEVLRQAGLLRSSKSHSPRKSRQRAEAFYSRRLLAPTSRRAIPWNWRRLRSSYGSDRQAATCLIFMSVRVAAPPRSHRVEPQRRGARGRGEFAATLRSAERCCCPAHSVLHRRGTWRE